MMKQLIYCAWLQAARSNLLRQNHSLPGFPPPPVSVLHFVPPAETNDAQQNMTWQPVSLQ
jgi:hypothetical protein